MPQNVLTNIALYYNTYTVAFEIVVENAAELK